MKTNVITKLKDLKKVWIILGAVLVVICVVLGIVSAVDSSHRAAAAKQRRLLDENTVTTRVTAIAAEHGLTDLEFDHLEDPSLQKQSRNAPDISCYFNSERFCGLDEDEMTDILADIAYLVNYDDKLFLPNGEFAGKTPFVYIQSGGDEYRVAAVDGTTHLTRNNVIIYEKKTAYSDLVNKKLDETIRRAEEIMGRTHKDTSGVKTKCEICNGTGYVRYYYGSSWWEAFLDGQPDYTTGPCTSCDGEGYVYK